MTLARASRSLYPGVVGANGAGKSTLLNLILDKLRPTEGHIFRHHNLRLASFTQHHGDQFDLRLSAVENFESMFPKSDTQVSPHEKDMRRSRCRSPVAPYIADPIFAS